MRFKLGNVGWKPSLVPMCAASKAFTPKTLELLRWSNMKLLRFNLLPP